MERYWMAKKALLNIPVIEGALPPDTFTQVVLYADAQRALDAEREKVAKLEKIQAIDLKNNNEYREQLATLQAQLADRDAMILQMGKQAARLAKDGIAAKAQLRQVEGAYQKLLNVIDDSHDEDLPIEIIEARDEAYKFLVAQDAKPRKCPTCDSPSPHLHPAVQHEGEVQVCSNRWHKAAQDAGKEDVSHD